MKGPLDGIRVLECDGYLSAPTAGYMLGDLGAEVIKVEDRVKGDPTRGVAEIFGQSTAAKAGINVLFETANRHKKSMTLELDKEKGMEILHQLVKVSDVFLTNYSQSAIAKLGIDYESLKKYNPKLIYALATGYGTQGPESQKRAFDTIAQARSGMMYSLGESEGIPAQIGGIIFDQMTGTLLAYGILAALVARDRQGVGQMVDVSLLGSGIHLQAYGVNTATLRNRTMKSSRSGLKNPMANHYECADGKWIVLSESQTDRFWHNFCDALGIQNLEKDPRFVTVVERKQNFRELTALIENTFKTKSRDEWVALLETKGGGLAFSPILRLTELATDPQVLANDYVTKVQHPTLGPINVVGVPVKFSETPASAQGWAPEFGQQTEEVLQNVLGYSWEDITKLKEEEVI
jgi:crotonobetainyl-CoA:carnitine CoA-transferase CaiB-like acyl-CoA transferase